MKKILLSLFVIAVSSYAVKAQVAVMPKAGVTIFTMSSEDEKIVHATGYQLGAAFGLPVTKAFSIQPELLYTQKGYRREDGHNTQYYRAITFRLNYLELPVMAKYSFRIKSLKAYVNAGPSVGYALYGRFDMEGKSIPYDEKVKFADKRNDAKLFDANILNDESNRIDVALQAGAGIGFPIGPGYVVLDARYGYGLNTLFKKEVRAYFYEAVTNHRGFAFTIGYEIPIGRKSHSK
jgi:hypothetical protein